MHTLTHAHHHHHHHHQNGTRDEVKKREQEEGRQRQENSTRERKFGGRTVNKRSTQIFSFKSEDFEKQKRRKNFGEGKRKTSKQK